MTKYKKLYEHYTTALDENAKLKKQVETLESQRRALVKELDKAEDLRKTVGSVVSALSENITKSLKAKNVVNMKPDEKDSMYYMLERFADLIIVMKPDDK